MRVPQLSNGRGSLKWIQVAVNDFPSVIDSAIHETGVVASDDAISWLSPLRDDEFAEYSDQDFLDRLSITLPRRSLESFWPKRGPQWDALGRTDSGAVLIVEAKANVPEVVSPGTQASSQSRELIDASIAETKAFLGIDPDIRWTGKLYQYANRLAHLYLLRELNGFDARLLNVYFVGDEDVDGPKTVAEWKSALTVVKRVLGLPNNHRLARYAADVLVDVANLN